MIRLAILWAKYGNTNVCAVNWSKLSRYTYSGAAYNTRAVARYVATFVQALVKNSVFTMDQITLSGHSMGGQISGLAGYFLKGLGLTLKTIIGNYSIFVIL